MRDLMLLDWEKLLGASKVDVKVVALGGYKGWTTQGGCLARCIAVFNIFSDLIQHFHCADGNSISKSQDGAEYILAAQARLLP